MDTIVKDYNALDDACTAAMNAGALSVEGPLFEAIWRSHDTILKHLDVDGWISWFIYDNDCGQKAHQATASEQKPLKSIRTTRQLATLIVEGENYSNA